MKVIPSLGRKTTDGLLRAKTLRYPQAYLCTSSSTSNRFAQDQSGTSKRWNGGAPFVHGTRNSKKRKPFSLEKHIKPNFNSNRDNDQSYKEVFSRNFLESLKNRAGGALFHESALFLASSNRSPRSLGEVRPGDFVEVQASSEYVGVVLPTESNASLGIGNRQFALLMVRGEIKKLNLFDVVNTFPAFIDEGLAQRAIIKKEEGFVFDMGIRTEDMAEVSEIDIHCLRARAEVCERLRILLHQAELQRSNFLPFFERRYLSSNLQTNLSSTHTSVSDVCKQMLIDSGLKNQLAELESNAPEKIYATHQLILSAPEVFRLDPTSHRLTNTFNIVPAADRNAQNVVRQEIQSSLTEKGQKISAKANQVQEFIAKVKQIRNLRATSSQAQVVNGVPRTFKDELSSHIEWSSSDKDILLFLRSALGIRREFISESSSGMVFHILKQCGYEMHMKPDSVDSVRGPYVQSIAMTKMQIAKLLRDVGLLTPWDNLSNLENEFQQLTSIALPNQQIATQDWTDPDAKIRKDVHSIVYVIDDANAQELDDGISLERTDDPNQSWIHIHIADPTSVIQPEDEVARFAENRGLTYYMNEGTWPMLPKEYVQKLGLLPDKDYPAQIHRRAMTFSAKIDHSTGAALDCNISLSKLHHVQIISYKEATELIGTSDRGNVQRDDLNTLFQLSRSIQKRRYDVSGGFLIKGNLRGKPVHVSPVPLPTSPIRSPSFDNLSRQLFSGFPNMELIEQESESQEHTYDSRGMVSELAIVACRVAGRWMEQHNIPALYRCQFSFDDPDITRQFLAQKDEHGTILGQDAMQEQFRMKPVMLSPTPSEHFVMGIRTEAAKKAKKLDENKDDVLLTAGYVRSTSPLRRYADMMMHWQIRHKIRSLSCPNFDQTQNLPFSYETIRDSIPSISRKENWIKNLEISSHVFWAALKLHRAYLARLSPEKRKEIEPFDQFSSFPSAREDLEDEKINSILDQEQDAMITLGDLRHLPNNETVIVVYLVSCGLIAQCRWPNQYLPKLGQMIKVRIEDILFQGSAPTITVERVDGW